jgi:TolA-binding protein
MKKLLFLLPILLLADVDPFQAGNLNSKNPYGLTPQEKAIYKNKQNIIKNSKLILSLKKDIDTLKSSLAQKFVQYDQTISDMSNKLSSFSTILSEIDAAKRQIDGLQKKLNEYNLSNMQEKLKNLEQRVSNLEKSQTALRQSFEEFTKISNQNYQNLSNSINEILNALKNINKKPLSPKEAYNKAKKLFFAGKYNQAKELFLYSLQKRHLPATSSFYLGEIAFKKGNYEQALAFYKKSISLYPKKTSFTAKLLYHTGISFLKLGQRKEAKLTFIKLKTDFPGSKYATLAQKELEKL